MDIEGRESDDDNSPYSITQEVLENSLGTYHFGRIDTQILASFIACLSAISFGTAIGWSNPVTYHLSKTSELPPDFALLVSMVPLGCCFGIIKCKYIMKHVGPKKTLQIQAPFYIVTWWLILIPNDTIQWIGRFVLGFLGITHFITGDCLLKQTVHFTLAKYAGVGFNSAVFTGILFSHIFGSLLTQFWLTFISATIPIIHFILLFMIPESPVYLYEKNHMAAQKSLEWYRGKQNAYLDMKLLRNYWETLRIDPETYKYMLYSKVVYKGILIVIGVTFYQVFSGYFIFLFYSIHIWNCGNTIITDIADSTIIAFYFFISKLLWGIIHVKYSSWKIKKFLIASCFICGIHQFFLSSFIYGFKQNLSFTRNSDWLPLILLAIMIFFYDMGLSYYPQILIFEYMPFQVFSYALTICQTTFWFLIFINSFCFVGLMKYNSHYIFIILGVLLMFGTIFCYYFVVEPIGKSLIQIQIEIGGNPVGNRGTMYTRMVNANEAKF